MLSLIRWFICMLQQHLTLMRLNYYQNCTIHTQTHTYECMGACVFCAVLIHPIHTYKNCLINEHLSISHSVYTSLCCQLVHWGLWCTINLVNDDDDDNDDIGTICMFIRCSVYDNISIYFAHENYIYQPICRPFQRPISLH